MQVPSDNVGWLCSIALVTGGFKRKMEVQDQNQLAASLLLVVLRVAGFICWARLMIVRVLSVVVGCCLWRGLMLTSSQGKDFVEFRQDAWKAKSRWPTCKGTIQSYRSNRSLPLCCQLFLCFMVGG